MSSQSRAEMLPSRCHTVSLFSTDRAAAACHHQAACARRASLRLAVPRSSAQEPSRKPVRTPPIASAQSSRQAACGPARASGSEFRRAELPPWPKSSKSRRLFGRPHTHLRLAHAHDEPVVAGSPARELLRELSLRNVASGVQTLVGSARASLQGRGNASVPAPSQSEELPVR